MNFELLQVISMLCLYAIAVGLACLFCSFLHSSEEENRYKNLDGMRGLAAVGVVACHITQRAAAYMHVDASANSVNIGDHVGIGAVQMFFALTAYLFTEKALNGKIKPLQLMIGRVRRIVPLYTFAVVLALLIGWYWTRHAGTSTMQSLTEGIKVAAFGFYKQDVLTFRGLNMLSLIGVAWTLSYEWAFYLCLIPASFLLNLSRKMLFPIFSLTFALIVCDYAQNQESVIWPFFLPGIVGATLMHYCPQPPQSIKRILPAASVLLLLSMIFSPGYWTAPKLLLSSALFLSILYSDPLFLRWKPLQFLGKISFSIYLLQYLVLFPMVKMMNSGTLMFQPTVVKVLGMAFVMCALIPLSVVTFYLIEKPFLAKSKRKNSNRASDHSQLSAELVLSGSAK